MADQPQESALARAWQSLKHPLRMLLAAGRFVVAHPIRTVLATLCFVVGIIGLVFPILPGWVFIFAGIFVLGPKSKPARWIRRKLATLRRHARVRWGLCKRKRRLAKAIRR
jgi:hypothetical protein